MKCDTILALNTYGTLGKYKQRILDDPTDSDGPGYVYGFIDPSNPDEIKIGFTMDHNPRDRVKKGSSKNEIKYDMIFAVFTNTCCKKVERLTHLMLAFCNMSFQVGIRHGQKEWFNLKKKHIMTLQNMYDIVLYHTFMVDKSVNIDKLVPLMKCYQQLITVAMVKKEKAKDVTTPVSKNMMKIVSTYNSSTCFHVEPRREMFAFVKLLIKNNPDLLNASDTTYVQQIMTDYHPSNYFHVKPRRFMLNIISNYNNKQLKN